MWEALEFSSKLGPHEVPGRETLCLGWANLFCSHTVGILGFVGHSVSDSTTQCGHGVESSHRRQQRVSVSQKNFAYGRDSPSPCLPPLRHTSVISPQCPIATSSRVSSIPHLWSSINFPHEHQSGRIKLKSSRVPPLGHLTDSTAL